MHLHPLHPLSFVSRQLHSLNIENRCFYSLKLKGVFGIFWLAPEENLKEPIQQEGGEDVVSLVLLEVRI